MRKIYSLLLLLTLNFAGFAFAPTTQTSNLAITYKSTSSATITWTRGNGASTVIVLRKASSTQSTPPGSTTVNYNASSTYGSGSSLGNGDNYLVYEGTGTSVTVYGLAPNTYYYAYAYEYNSAYIYPSVWYYYNTSISTGNYEGFVTLETQPTSASNVYTVSSSYTSANIYFTHGSGADGSLIYLRPSTGSNAYPSDGYYYYASTAYGSGYSLGGGYVMYNGSATSVSVSNLMPATYYYAYAQGYGSGTYPTSSYQYNTRNYYLTGTSYGFYTLNYAPTISSVSNYTVCQNSGLTYVSLYGISDGSSLENQTVSVSATSSNTSLIPNPTITYTSPGSSGTLKFQPNTGVSGTAVITVTVNDGWFTNNTVSTQFTVTVNPIPSTPSSISGASPICAGTSASYTVSTTANATGYTWSAPSGYTITAGQGTNAITVSTTTNTTTGSLQVYGTNSYGCGNGNTYSQQVQIDANPGTPDAGVDQPLVCTQTAFLNATAPGPGDVGQWSWLSGTPTPSIGDANSNSTSISGLTSPKTYQYIWTVNKTGSVCPAKKDTITITTDWANISCSPAANFNYSPVSDVSSTSVCVGSTINFTDLSVSADTWSWDFNYNGSIPSFTDFTQNPTYTFNTVGTYSVYLRIHSNATSQDYNTTKTITVIDAPAAPGTISGTTNGICAGSSPIQFNYSISNVSNATNYNWTVPTGANIVGNPSPNFIVVEFYNNAVPGNITVSSMNSCGTSSANSLMVNVTPLPVAPGSISGPLTVCQGEQNVAYTVPSITNATSYIWTALDGTISSTGTGSKSFNLSTTAQSGKIWVKGNNSCGDGDSASIDITVNPLPANAGLISGSNFLEICPPASNVSYKIDTSEFATNYQWIVSAGTVTYGAGTDSITVDFTGVNTPVTIQAIPSNACGVRDSSSSYNVSFSSVPMVDLCIASVDTASQYNEIYWTRPASSEIDSFRIYRRIGASTDTLVGTVAYNDPTYLKDTLSDYDPNSSLSQYTISAVDSCGNEGLKSPYHTTMFLSTSLGTGTVNLMWNLYVGQTVDFYKVYRDTTTSGPAQWDTLTAQINPSATTWVDNNPIAGARYKIEVAWATTCDPTRGAINTSRSNIKSPSSVGIKSVNISNDDANLFPNPSSSNVTLTFTKNNGYKNIAIFDALGRLVYSDALETNALSYNFSVNQFAKGVYTVIASGKNGKISKRLVVE